MTASPPAASTTTTTTGKPARNKSNTNLHSISASHGTKPKRNKSSSSLSSHHHTTVQFNHHKKPSFSASHKAPKPIRKSAFDFGFTAIPTAATPPTAEPHDDDEDRNGRTRPRNDRRTSSSSSIATVRYEAAESTAMDRGRETSRSRSRSRDRRSRDSPPRHLRSPPNAPPPHPDEGIITPASITSDWESATDSPAPVLKKSLAPDFAPPRTTTTVQGLENGGPSSGLGRSMGVTDPPPVVAPNRNVDESDNAFGLHLGTEKQLANNGDSSQTLSKKLSNLNNGKSTSRAKFSTGGEESPPYPGSYIPPPPPSTLPPPPRQPEAVIRTTSFPIRQLSTRSAAPSSRQQSTRQPSTSAAPPVLPSSLNHAATDKIPFPSTIASPEVLPAPPPPVITAPLREGGRKNSNASLMSTRSMRSTTGSLSFGGLMGPPTSIRRNTSSGLAPMVDRKVVAAGVLSAGNDGLDEGRGGYKRSGSMSSLRSVHEGGAGRAATTGSAAGKELSRRLNPLREEGRLSISTSTTALSALAALNSSKQASPAGSPGFPSKRSASGYFSSLREYATGALSSAGNSAANSSNGSNTPGLPSPLSPHFGRTRSAKSSLVSRPADLAPFTALKEDGRNSASSSNLFSLHHQHSHSTNHLPTFKSTSTSAPIVSKFIEPPPTILPSAPAMSQRSSSVNRLRSSNGGESSAMRRNDSSSSLSNGGSAMSRTQQKALLARDRPDSSTMDSGRTGGRKLSSGNLTALVSSSTPPPPSPSPSAHSHQQQQQQQQQIEQQQQQQDQNQSMQKWAFGLIREAERIERQFQNVERFRDPIGDCLVRIGYYEKGRLGAVGGERGKTVL